MTTTRPFAAALSANDRFKLQYPRYVRRATLVALALTALFVWLFPRYEPVLYTLREKELVIIDIEHEIVLPEEPEIPVVPRLPPVIEVVKGGIEDPIPPDLFPIKWPVNPAPPAPVDDTPFVASSSNPVLIASFRADYPEIARRAGLEGLVMVRALVGVDGRVKQALVVRSVHPLLDRAAVAAARKCRFEPARQRLLKVQAWLDIPYRFRLHGE